MAGIRKKKELLDQLLRQEIVQVILTMIQEGTPITMDEVARRCGVSKGTLYNYFQNKEELLDHVHRAIIGPILNAHQQIFESQEDPLTRLHKFIESVFAIHERIATYFRFVWENKTAEDVYRERVEALMHPIAKICQEGIDKGEFINVDPYVLAEIIYGGAIGTLTTLGYRDTTHVDKQKLLQDVKKLIDKIIC
ncbi:TetR/AcrR family transcriptional regulator [Desulfogranum japonicum]|uniref:TetR/AcrR family transcriptional regulator n=1 Tax=Desulfogranum japonicum TaxID=231447 RepID=UPI00042645FC|nr:TetR/AcrR family transcriptional regulator [Desulfogranum japonicum]